MSGPWMSIIEYARKNNVSDMTVRRRIKTGRLNAELRDGKYFIPVQDTHSHQIDEVEFHIDLSSTFESERAEIPQTREFSRQESSYLAPVPSPSLVSQLGKQVGRLAEDFEMALDQIKEREELLKANFLSEKERFTEKLNFLSNELKSKENEIEKLGKEIEDLEILVKILESKTL